MKDTKSTVEKLREVRNLVCNLEKISACKKLCEGLWGLLQSFIELENIEYMCRMMLMAKACYMVCEIGSNKSKGAYFILYKDAHIEVVADVQNGKLEGSVEDVEVYSKALSNDVITELNTIAGFLLDLCRKNGDAKVLETLDDGDEIVSVLG